VWASRVQSACGHRVWASRVQAPGRVCGRVMCGRAPGGLRLVRRGQPRVLARGFSVVLSVRFPLQIFAVLDTHSRTAPRTCGIVPFVPSPCGYLAVGLPETLALSPLTHLSFPVGAPASHDSCVRIPPSARSPRLPRAVIAHSLDDYADPLVPPQDHMGNP
jgi:hypothetical protein